MNLQILKQAFFFILLTAILSSCEEDFDTITAYKDQTVVYAFLQQKDPWNASTDTNWVVVNKAFLGEASVSDMANVADSVNYNNYDEISVTLQRIKSIDPKSAAVDASVFNHEPIILHYTTHYKDTGAFATNNNIVFYTTKALMYHKDVNLNPRPDDDDSYFYRLTVKKPGKDSVYATTKMIRGIIEDRPLTFPVGNRYIDMASSFPNYTFSVQFGSNIDARIYDLKIRTFYYEKRTDGNIYLKYIDYQNPLVVTRDKNPVRSIDMEIDIPPLAFYSSISNQLIVDTTDVVWRVPKLTLKDGLGESHALIFTLGSQETYVYNQVTMPSDGIVQEKPSYTNIINGLGLFTSKWRFTRDHFELTGGTVDSLALGVATKNIKFKDYSTSVKFNDTITAGEVIKLLN